MGYFVLTLFNDLAIPSSHGISEAIVLVAGMGYLKACASAVVVVKECKNNEGIPDMIDSENTAKLPSARCKIPFLLL